MRGGMARICESRRRQHGRVHSKDFGFFSVQKQLSVYTSSLLEATHPLCPAQAWLHVLKEILWLAGIFQGFQIPIRAALPLRAQASSGNKKKRQITQVWKQISVIPAYFVVFLIFFQITSKRNVVSVRPNRSPAWQNQQRKFSL